MSDLPEYHPDNHKRVKNLMATFCAERELGLCGGSSQTAFDPTTGGPLNTRVRFQQRHLPTFWTKNFAILSLSASRIQESEKEAENSGSSPQIELPMQRYMAWLSCNEGHNPGSGEKV